MGRDQADTLHERETEKKDVVSVTCALPACLPAWSLQSLRWCGGCPQPRQYRGRRPPHNPVSSLPDRHFSRRNPGMRSIHPHKWQNPEKRRSGNRIVGGLRPRDIAWTTAPGPRHSVDNIKWPSPGGTAGTPCRSTTRSGAGRRCRSRPPPRPMAPRPTGTRGSGCVHRTENKMSYGESAFVAQACGFLKNTCTSSYMILVRLVRGRTRKFITRGPWPCVLHCILVLTT